MSLITVKKVAPLEQAVRDGAFLPKELVETVYGRMNDYLGREFDGSSYHTEGLVVSHAAIRRAVNVVFFVDTDGTLNVMSVEAGKPL